MKLTDIPTPAVVIDIDFIDHVIIGRPDADPLAKGTSASVMRACWGDMKSHRRSLQ